MRTGWSLCPSVSEQIASWQSYLTSTRVDTKNLLICFRRRFPLLFYILAFRTSTTTARRTSRQRNFYILKSLTWNCGNLDVFDFWFLYHRKNTRSTIQRLPDKVIGLMAACLMDYRAYPVTPQQQDGSYRKVEHAYICDSGIRKNIPRTAWVNQSINQSINQWCVPWFFVHQKWQRKVKAGHTH